MRVIGLTGGIGSGKSTVGRLLAEAGAIVIDADQVAREVVEPGEVALDQIVDRFGDAVLAADGTLDRAALAAIVFADAGALADLEAITHPQIGARIAERLAAVEAQELAGGVERLVVMEHPLLVETGQAKDHDVLVVVEAPMDVRIERLGLRGLGEDEARARIANQASDAERRAVASHVIDNGGDLEMLASQVAALVADLGIAA